MFLYAISYYFCASLLCASLRSCSLCRFCSSLACSYSSFFLYICSCIAWICNSSTSLFEIGLSKRMRFPNFIFSIALFSCSAASLKFNPISRTLLKRAFFGWGFGLEAWIWAVVLLAIVGDYRIKLGVTTEILDWASETIDIVSEGVFETLLLCVKETRPCLMCRTPILKLILTLSLLPREPI